MKISYNWLKQYIDLPEGAEEVAEVLTATGLEVEKTEEIETVPGGLHGLVIGQVLTCEAHPNADKLKVTTVDVGDGEARSIVCGAPNVEAGQKVVVATSGTTLHPAGGEPFKIKKTKIRGEVSDGMICAEDEIGLGEDHSGIIVLDANAPVGASAREYYKVESDHVFEIGLTPNRGDATSHIGVARDLRAVYDRPIKWPDVTAFQTGDHREIDVVVENTEACPRYSGVTITDIKVDESPEWLKARLRAIGLNPINNVVDITNFVLHETGQPLHAFDADEITGNKVIVKNMPENSVFKTLDEEERKLSARDLMICNAEEGMCIAGVFGGIKSGVKDSTTSIFLESACFSMDHIRWTAQHHQLKTDASFRFERGTDPELTVYAMKRAAQLICEIAGGKISSGITDIYPKKVEPFNVSVKYSNIDRLIGVRIDRGRIHSILNLLDITLEDMTDDGFTAMVPAYRVDVTREADVIEEILRIYGFNNIPLPESVSSDYMAEFPMDDPDNTRKVLTDMLTGRGFFEIMTNSLTKPQYAEWDDSSKEEESVNIINKLSEDLGVMRQRMLYTMLEVAAYNVSHKQRNLKLFEFGKSYHHGEKYQERGWLGLMITGEFDRHNWNRKGRNAEFYDLSALVRQVIGRVSGKEVETEVRGGGTLSYGLDFLIDGKRVASAGSVDKKTCRKLQINQEVFYAEIDWKVLNRKATSRFTYKEVPKYPEVKRDLSLVLDKKVSFDTVQKVAISNSNHLVKKLSVFDVYEGEKIGKDQKAYAISFILQDNTKTLTDKIIDKTMTKLMAAFEKELNAVIRK